MKDIFYQRANDIIKKYSTNNPRELAEAMGVHIYYRNDFKRLLGMYSVVQKRRCIFIKSDIDEELMNIVIAHELGHDQFHRAMAKQNGLKEFVLFDMNTRSEYEANVFAAHLLIPDAEVIKFAGEGYDIVQMSALLNTNINLSLIKINEMIKLGYTFNPQDTPKTNFFKDLGKK